MYEWLYGSKWQCDSPCVTLCEWDWSQFHARRILINSHIKRAKCSCWMLSITFYYVTNFLSSSFIIRTHTKICKPGSLFRTWVFGFGKLQTWVSGSGLPMTDERATLWAWHQSSPSHHPTISLPINRCQSAFHVQERRLLHVLHQQLETEHQKVSENISKHHQLIASCKQKRTVSQSFRYHIHIVINHHWSLIWRN